MPREKPHALPTILTAGFACGVLDLTAAFVVWGLRAHVGPVRIMQSIASGLLGGDAYHDGVKTAILGVAIHFLIATSAAAVFYVASRMLTFLTSHAVISGFLYGITVHIFMSFVVIPLSASPMRNAPFSPTPFLIGTLIHMFCVGLPIALVVRHYSK